MIFIPLRAWLPLTEKIKPFVLSQQSDESLKLIDIRDALLPKLLSGEITLISDEDRK